MGTTNDSNKKKKVYKKLRNKYRLVLLRDETFEERLAVRLTPLNVFTYIGLVLIFLIVIVTAVIAFTPLREYIPGYSNVEMKRNAAYAVFKADSLEHELDVRNQYLNNVRTLLRGDVPTDSLREMEELSTEPSEIEDVRSRADSNLRDKVEQSERYALTSSQAERSRATAYFFFTPIEGTVTSSFSPDKDHYGVDIAAKEGESIKAVLDGTVIFAGWTPENGYVLHLHHRNNLVSVYKHCSVLMNKKGQSVQAGEAVAMVGNTGRHTTGPHLHFELWDDGEAINPEDYITF